MLEKLTETSCKFCEQTCYDTGGVRTEFLILKIATSDMSTSV